VEKNKKFN